MKKVLLIFGSFVLAQASFSQLIIKENFDKYTAGQNVENKTPGDTFNWQEYVTEPGDWVVSSDEKNRAGTSPKVQAAVLTYPGYAGSPSAKVLEMNGSTQGTDVESRITAFRFQKEAVKPGTTLYFAMMVNLGDMANKRKPLELFNLYRVTQSYSKPDATASCTTRGRVFVSTDNTGYVTVSFCKGTQPVSATQTFAKGQTALLVLKWDHKSNGSKGDNDLFYLYVNPDPNKSEADNAGVMITPDDNETTLGGADLRQIGFRQAGGKIFAKIGGIRVAGSFEGAVK